MRFISLFSGIGGLDLGLERAGMTCAAQVEIRPFQRAVLAKHWPNLPRFADVRTFGRKDVDGDVDLVAGGFPCQDISISGHGAGLAGDRSGLWFEFHRIICEFRPRYVVVENVPALLHRGLRTVLGCLAESGFDAEWDCLPASAFGAYHERDRIFILAYRPRGDGVAHDLLEASRDGRASLQSARLHRRAVATRGKRPHQGLEHEPRLARLVHGIPDQVHRIEGCGNAVYPAVGEWIGRRLMAAAGGGG